MEPSIFPFALATRRWTCRGLGRFVQASAKKGTSAPFLSEKCKSGAAPPDLRAPPGTFLFLVELPAEPARRICRSFCCLSPWGHTFAPCVAMGLQTKVSNTIVSSEGGYRMLVLSRKPGQVVRIDLLEGVDPRTPIGDLFAEQPITISITTPRRRHCPRQDLRC